MIRRGYIICFSRYIRKLVIVILISTASLSVISAQKNREEAPPLKERLFFGGNLGLQFGTITDIQVAPVVGLWLLPRVAVAVGPDYHFFKYSGFQTNIYGGKGYMEFVVFQNINKFIPMGANTGIFIHVEDEILNLESAAFPEHPHSANRFNINTFLIGPGLSQQIGQRASLNIMFLWALNDSVYGIYGNPDIRVSFTF